MVVMDGLIEGEAAPGLHPALSVWHGHLARRRRKWFACAPMTALEWYGLICALPGAPAAWLAARVRDMPKMARQCWVASPYYAVVGRDDVQVAPDKVLDWSPEDTRQLAALLNPLLADEGMQLLCAGTALLAVCDRAWDISPPGFGLIAGGRLPNRMPEGRDAGRFSRLQAEIQMLLAQKPLSRGEKPPVSGLWLWGASPWPVEIPASRCIVSDDASLSGLFADARAQAAILRAETAAEHWTCKKRLPARIVLAGPRHCVLLRSAPIPRLLRQGWYLRNPEPLTQLPGQAWP